MSGSVFIGLVKEFLIPGSLWFLTAAASVCCLLLFGSERMRRTGRVTLASVLVYYWISSLPAIAALLQSVSEFGSGVYVKTRLVEVSVIVVFGNGMSAVRSAGGVIGVPLTQTARNALKAAELYRAFPGSVVVASGGGNDSTPGTSEAAIIRDMLVSNGVPDRQILLDASSTNTREQAVDVAALLKSRNLVSCVLVTSESQMHRAVEALYAVGIRSTPAAATWDEPAVQRRGIVRWMPDSEAQGVSRDVLYEFLARGYYRWRGWTRNQPN